MNTFNLTKRPTICLPETAEGMLNLLTYNALEQAGIEQDKADYWEGKYIELKKFVEDLAEHAEVKMSCDGTAYIDFEYLSSKYDGRIFDSIIKNFNFGAKLIAAEANLKKEETE